MPSLHIDHAISDLSTWLAAFNRFHEARTNAGVTSVRVRQPADDDHYIYIDLDFDTVAEAAAFKEFLEAKVWSSADASPGLAGAPRARVLSDVAITA
jgi:hypothetical protein